MKKLIKTYGKTIHLWQIDRGDKIPMGVPQLMMAYKQDSQVDWDIIKKRDELYGSNYKDLRKNRADLEEPIVDPRADHWEKGKATQFAAIEADMKFPK